MPLEPGDLFLFFTDGITEAMNAARGAVRRGPPRRAVEEHADLPFDELRERILREVARVRRRAAAQHDDMTLILLKVDHMAFCQLQRDRALRDRRHMTASPSVLCACMLCAALLLVVSASAAERAGCVPTLIAVHGRIYTVRSRARRGSRRSPSAASGSCGRERAPRSRRWRRPARGGSSWRGRPVVPGFNDSHVHLIDGGTRADRGRSAEREVAAGGGDAASRTSSGRSRRAAGSSAASGTTRRGRTRRCRRAR